METLDTWVDAAAGPVVRPYTMTGGRTRPRAGSFDLVAFVVTVESSPPVDAGLQPEHLAVLAACDRPLSVAELAARLKLPLGVVRVLLGDLLDQRLIAVREPAPEPRLPDQSVLMAVKDGLQAL